MQLYVVFGSETERLCQHLMKEYHIVGSDRTIEAAIAATSVLSEKRKPEVFLVLGTALASMMVDGRLDGGAALISNLTKLRQVNANSRIVVILAEDTSKTLVRDIARLGIYDIHCVEKVTIPDLITFINTPKTFADYDVAIKSGGSLGSVVMDDEEKQAQKRLISVSVGGFLNKLKLARRKKEEPAVDVETDAGFGEMAKTLPPEPDLADDVPEIQKRDEIELPAILTASGVVPADPRDSRARAVFVPSTWGLKALEDLRKDIGHLPLVVVGQQEDGYYQAGADFCVPNLADRALSVIRDFADRTQLLWSNADPNSSISSYSRSFLDEWLATQYAKPHPVFAIMAVALSDIEVQGVIKERAQGVLIPKLASVVRSHFPPGHIVVHYQDEELIIALPWTDKVKAEKLADQLQEKWLRQRIEVDGQRVVCSLLIAIAEWSGHDNVLEKACRMLTRIRNQNKGNGKKLLVLCQQVFSVDFRNWGIRLTSDPAEAQCILTDLANFRFAPPGISLIVLGSGTIADFVITQKRPDAIVCQSESEAMEKVAELLDVPCPPPVQSIAPTCDPVATSAPRQELVQPQVGSNIAVLPGGRATEKGQTLVQHSALYVVAPSQPSIAGKTSAQLAKGTADCALVCAVPESRAALTVGVPQNDLLMADWRIPGSKAPVELNGLCIWPIDPFKHLDAYESVHTLIDRIRSKFALVIVDCGASIETCSRTLKTDGVLLVRSGMDDESDQVINHWLRNYGGPNVLTISAGDVPEIVVVENGFIVVPKAQKLANQGR